MDARVCRPAPAGGRGRFDVRITAADGTLYQARVAVPLTTRVDAGGFPEACDRQDGANGAFTEYCNSSEFRYVVTSGISG
jgi:hypothetical protein